MGILRGNQGAPFSAEIPDSFYFFLLDSTFNPFTTSDPTGANALFVIDITNATTPIIFTSSFATVTITQGGAAPVPEPVTILLLGSGLGGLAALQLRKLRHQKGKVSDETIDPRNHSNEHENSC